MHTLRPEGLGSNPRAATYGMNCHGQGFLSLRTKIKLIPSRFLCLLFSLLKIYLFPVHSLPDSILFPWMHQESLEISTNFLSALVQGSANCALQAKSSLHLVLQIKFYWNTTMPLHLRILSGYFPTNTADLIVRMETVHDLQNFK
jgi:hypothetical protein